MTLIVEIGASNSESYATVAEADLYFSNRGEATWAALTEAKKEQNLRKATDYMEQTYRLRWLGYRHSETQALSWPRNEVQRLDFTYLNQWSYYPDNEVPAEVKNACAELALKASENELSPDLTRRTIREKIDTLEVEYSEYGAEYIRYRAIDNLLAPFIDGGNTGAIRKVMR